MNKIVLYGRGLFVFLVLAVPAVSTQEGLPNLISGIRTAALWFAVILFIGWLGFMYIWSTARGGMEALRTIFDMLGKQPFGDLVKYAGEVLGVYILALIVIETPLILIALFFTGYVYDLIVWLMQVIKVLFPDIPLEIPESPFDYGVE